MTQPRKQPPFSINHDDARSLLRQVTDGLRLAIADGYYQCGDLLPSSRDLAPALGVSKIVTEAALKRLAAEGLVESRPRLGTVVRDRSAKQWLGHVLFVYPEYDVGYFQAILSEELRSRLNAAGYLFTRASVGAEDGKGARYDFFSLDAALSRSVDLAIVLYDRPAIFRHLAKRNVPFSVVGQLAKMPPSAVGLTRLDYDMAVPDFAAACRAAGARKVVQFGWDRLMCDAAPGLRETGIAVTGVTVKPDFAGGKLAGIERAGLDAFARLAATGKLSRDAVYFFADDYIGRGALSAISGAGLRAPDDIRVATWANKGLGPVYFRELSRMEMDPAEAGATVADSILEYLRTGRYPGGRTIGPSWVEGETMGKQCTNRK